MTLEYGMIKFESPEMKGEQALECLNTFKSQLLVHQINLNDCLKSYYDEKGYSPKRPVNMDSPISYLYKIVYQSSFIDFSEEETK